MAVGINGQRPVLMIADLIETIQIDSNGTTLDGNGYSTTGNYGDEWICESTYTPYGNNIDYLSLTSNLASVTINLVSIGGSAGTPMTRISGTDIYTITSNATSCNNFPTTLLMNATDTSGNFNNSVGIQLAVLLPGDVNFDCKIDLKDLLFMRRYLSGLEPLI